ncbi:MAG: glycosyltransferase [Mycobacterium leprae]
MLGAVHALLTALAQPGVDVVHAHAPSSAALLIALLGSPRRLRNCVFTLHGSYSHFRLRSRLLLHAVFAVFPTLVVCGHSPYRTLPSSLRRLGQGKIQVIQNGVDVDRVDRILALSSSARPTADLATRPFTVIFVGRLIDVKNPSGLLRAFLRLEDSSARLVFVGDGYLRTPLMQEAARHAPGRVLFTGLVDRDDVYRHLADADLYVSMSYSEGLPVAVLEAMACRLPVVLSDICAHREIVGDAGFVPLASPDDVDGVVRAIERLQRMPRADREKIADRCRALVADRFSVRAMNRQYERVYLDVARRQGDGENRIQTRGTRPRRDEMPSYGEVGRRRSRPEGCA